jgi:hypothetical protein
VASSSGFSSLGIGISVRHYESKKSHIRSIFSPLDLLSYSAFLDGVREAVYDVDAKTQQKVTFAYWLPLCMLMLMLMKMERFLTFVCLLNESCFCF